MKEVNAQKERMSNSSGGPRAHRRRHGLLFPDELSWGQRRPRRVAFLSHLKGLNAYQGGHGLAVFIFLRVTLLKGGDGLVTHVPDQGIVLCVFAVEVRFLNW